MKTMRANLLLLLTAAIWGSAFVAQSVGGELVPPFTFLATRSWLGALTLMPLVLLRGRGGSYRTLWKPTLAGGILCGLALFAASAAQQYGMSLDASASMAGFLTTLYVPIVPLISWVVFRRRIGLRVWGSIALAVIGLALLTGGGFGMGAGERMLLLCALLYAVHILVIDRFSDRTDPVLMSQLQFAVCAAASTIAALCFDTTSVAAMWDARWSILYAGVLSSGVAYTLQVVAQKDTSPTVASLLMSLESVFACLSGWVILHDALSVPELLGCALMFGAVILAQLPGQPSQPAASRSDSR